MAPAEAAGEMRIEVVYCLRPGVTDLVTVRLPAGATVADALCASGLALRHALKTDDLRVGVWSRVVEPETPLRDRDRVEIYRPLTVDPKEARRQRYTQHKERLARG
jgi:hypothetical protein